MKFKPKSTRDEPVSPREIIFSFDKLRRSGGYTQTAPECSYIAWEHGGHYCSSYQRPTHKRFYPFATIYTCPVCGKLNDVKGLGPSQAKKALRVPVAQKEPT